MRCNAPCLTAAIALIATPALGAEPCIPPLLSKPAVRLVRPVLSELLLAQAEEFDSSGRFRKPSTHRAVFERRFYALLARRSAPAAEAIAALLCFYTGEHLTEDLVCAAVERGAQIRPYLLAFEACPPKTGLEPIPSFITSIPNLRTKALEQIRNGLKCEAE